MNSLEGQPIVYRLRRRFATRRSAELAHPANHILEWAPGHGQHLTPCCWAEKRKVHAPVSGDCEQINNILTGQCWSRVCSRICRTAESCRNINLDCFIWLSQVPMSTPDVRQQQLSIWCPYTTKTKRSLCRACRTQPAQQSVVTPPPGDSELKLIDHHERCCRPTVGRVSILA